MVIQEPPINHLRMDVARNAQLQAELAPRNLLLDLIGHMDDMAQSVRLERKKGR